MSYKDAGRRKVSSGVGIFEKGCFQTAFVTKTYKRAPEKLSEAFGDQLVLRREEGGERSSYRLGSMEVCFQVKGERHFPVALASMVAKYTRELAMEAFNAYWSDVCPGVRSTRGYPVDARRFRDDVRKRLDDLEIAEDVFWRRK